MSQEVHTRLYCPHLGSYLFKNFSQFSVLVLDNKHPIKVSPCTDVIKVSRGLPDEVQERTKILMHPRRK